MLKEFKEFIAKGNVADLAVGIIIGGAFGKIVASLVADIIMPLVGLILGGVDFTTLSFTVGEATVAYGNFIQTVVDFIIIAISVFFFVKALNRLRRDKDNEKAEAAKS